MSNEINTITIEITILSIVGILFLFFTTMTNIKNRKTRMFQFLKIVVAIAIVSFFIFIGLLPYIYNLNSNVLFINGVVFLLSAISAIFILVQQIIVNTNKEGLVGIIVLLLNWFISCGIFIAWSYSLIPLYEIASTITFILNLIMIIFIFYRQVKIENRQNDVR